MMASIKDILACVKRRLVTDTPIKNNKTGIAPVVTNSNAELHVAVVYFNHRSFKNLLTNFQEFVIRMQALNVTLHIVEVVLNDSEFEVTDSNNNHHVQLRTKYELFHKENLINIAFANTIKLYPDCKYLAWIDADLTFMNPDIVQDTIKALQRHKVVQMWGSAIELGPDGHPLVLDNKTSVVSSFAYDYVNSQSLPVVGQGYATKWHPGYAYAIRRSTYVDMGGLFETSILGAGDHHMVWAFVGSANKGIHGLASASYKKASLEHLYKIKDVINKDFGYVNGTIIHHWHGTKNSRRYVERWSILVDSNFDPVVDLVKRKDGLLELTGNNTELRDGIRRYFQLRNDDCNVTEEFFKLKL